MNSNLSKSLGLFFLSSIAIAPNAKAQPKPNFVFIMLDDQSYDAIQSAGRYKFLDMPNIDRLEKEGVKFTNYFCAQSLCSPQRATLLTGVYPHIHGVTQNHPKIDPDWEKYPTFGSYLQKAGYQTAFICKIHNALKKDKEAIRPGFDYWVSLPGQGVYLDPVLNINGVDTNCTGYVTDLLSDLTVKYIKNYKSVNPFSICLWHKAVHGPFTPAERHSDLYKNEFLPLPPYGMANETFAGKPKWQIQRAFGGKNVSEIPDSLPIKKWNAKDESIFKLFRALKSVDESVGKIYQVLKEKGLLDNTVIIFTSDNGFFMGDHTYHDKRLAYESSMRIPLIIRYPNVIKAGSLIHQLCSSIDVPVSILDIAGVKKPKQMQGESFLPLLKGKTVPWRESVFYEYFRDLEYPYAGPTQYAVRSERYKFVDGMTDGQINELYDLQKDPGEMVNQINNPNYAIMLKDLMAESVRLKKYYQFNPDPDWRIKMLLGDSAVKPKPSKVKNE